MPGLYELARRLVVLNWPFFVISVVVLSITIFMAFWNDSTWKDDLGFMMVFSIVIGSTLVAIVTFSVVDIAAYRTALTHESEHGLSAVVKAGFGRFAIYFAMNVVYVIYYTVLAAILFVVMGVILAIDPWETTDPWFEGIGLGLANVLAAGSLGLLFPDLAMTGRVRLGWAVSKSILNFRRIFVLLMMGSVPASAASEAVFSWYEIDVVAASILRGTDELTAPDLAAIGLMSLLHVLSAFLAIAALSKVYFNISPPEEQIGSERVAEVFE